MRVEHPRRLAVLGGALLVAVVAGTAAWSVTAGRDVDDLLPNLEQASPGELSGRDGGTEEKPRFFLGFRSAAANLGDGPLVVLGGRRNTTTSEMRLRQQIRRSDGSTRTVPLRARLRYVRSADHAHWHVLRFMRYELRSATARRVFSDRKTGFCLGDRYRVLALPGRETSARYSDRCGRGAPRLLKIREGISVGWGDDYAAHLEGQEFEITALRPGRYVLVHRVNVSRDILESDYTDNVASMAFDLAWPRGRKLPPRLDVVARCPRMATCP